MKTFIFLLLAGLTIGCTRYSAKEAPPKVAEAKPACQTAQLAAEVQQIAAITKGPVGAGFELLGTNESAFVEGQRHFPMQSVYKFPIAILVLREVDAGKLSLDQLIAIKPADFVSDREFTIRRKYPQGAELSLREVLRYMISESDGTACD